MTCSAIAALAVLASLLPQASAPAAPQVGIEYRRPLGQVAEYRLLLDVSGEQISLGERRPVRLKAELALTEEVIAQGRDGLTWLRVEARSLKVADSTGTFAAGARGDWPPVQLRVTPRGEVLDVSAGTGERRRGMAERSFLSLMAQPSPVLLPARPVAPGEEWEWEMEGARQRNRLVEIAGEGPDQLARIASEGLSPLALLDRSDALGLATQLSGEVKQRSELDLLTARGLAARHRGDLFLSANSQVTLELPEGPRQFAMKTNLKIEFDLKLVSVDGEPVSLR